VVDYMLDLTYSYGAAAFRSGTATLCLADFSLPGYPEMEVTTVANPEGTGQMFPRLRPPDGRLAGL